MADIDKLLMKRLPRSAREILGNNFFVSSPEKKVFTAAEFFKEVQRRTGQFTRDVGDEKVPYDIFPQQMKWLELFDSSLPKRRALLASRDKGKSQIVSTFGSAWQLYNNPTVKIAVMSFKHDNASKLVHRAVEILEAFGMEMKHRDGGYFLSENKDATPSLIAFGLQSTARSMHFDYLILDDPLTINEQHSKKYIDRSRYFLNEGSSIAKYIILIGQLLTRNDLYYDAYGNIDNVYHLVQSWHGDIPELDKDLEYETRAIGKKDVARNYLGYIDDGEDAIFQSIQFSQAKPEGDIFAFIDPSAKGRDFTAVAIGWVYEARLIIYGEIFKKNWGDCLEEITKLVSKCKFVWYEDNQGTSMGAFLRERGVRSVGVTTTANKIAKIYGLRPLILQERLLLSNYMPADAIMQVKNWTETAEHDDLPDAIAMLVNKMEWRIHR
ncbi:MAG: hypothetical protein ACRCVN_05915 [Spirochaetia bacterium]